MTPTTPPTTLEQKQTLMSAKASSELRQRRGDKPDYYRHVKPCDGGFSFSIQLEDSLEGDLWWRGVFRMIDGVDVELVESEKSGDGVYEGIRL